MRREGCDLVDDRVRAKRNVLGGEDVSRGFGEGILEEELREIRGVITERLVRVQRKGRPGGGARGGR